MARSETTPTALGALFVAACLAAACANHQIPYGDISLDLEYSGRRTVAVAVIDARTRLGEGRHDPSVVGETMAGGARRKPITTNGGEPLAAIVARTLVAALEAAGFAALVVEATADEEGAAIIERAGDLAPAYLWMIDIEDWWTARHRQTTHTYKLGFAVIGADEGVLVQRSLTGTVRWDEHGAREGGPDLPRKSAARSPVAPAAPASAGDPDAFDQLASGIETGALPKDTPEDEAATDEAPAVEAVEAAATDPVADYLVLLLGDLLHDMVNDPGVPRQMVRFP